MASTLEIVQCLIDNGARMIARLVDGRTALHIAAARGNAEMVKALMNRSFENEEDEEETIDFVEVEGDDDANSEASEISLQSEEGSDSMTMGSFVKVDKEKDEVSIECHENVWLLTHSNLGGS